MSGRRVPDPEETAEKEERKAKSVTDVQRIRLERLFDNIEKPVRIPLPKNNRPPRPPPEFVRNVVGSSAGAGSADFHIYRNNRKKEFARLEYIEKLAKEEEADKEYLHMVQEKRAELDEKTNKKRAKRLKKKQRAKGRKKQKTEEAKKESSSEEESEEEEESSQPTSAQSNSSSKDAEENAS